MSPLVVLVYSPAQLSGQMGLRAGQRVRINDPLTQVILVVLLAEIHASESFRSA